MVETLMKLLFAFTALVLTVAYVPFRHKQSATMATVVNSPAPTVSGATPGFVSAVSKQQVTVGTNPSGQTSCTNYTICTPYAESILSGNIALDFVTYVHVSTSLSITDTNDKSDSYTCANGSKIGDGSSLWIGYCLSTAPTAGAHVSKVGFASTATTLSTVMPMSFYNTNGTLDGSIGSCTGSATTTVNCGSVTTTVANDLIVVFACTDAAHTFTAGTGYTLGAANANYGCVSEFEVNTGTGSVTPSITVDSSTSYTEIVLALKAASQGTQPTSSVYANGWVQRICSDTNAPVVAAFKVQCPSSGNFLLDLNAFGSGQTISSITDTTNTFSQVKCGNSGGTDGWVSGGAVADATGVMTVNTNNTGDGTYAVYDIAGAPSSPNISCANYGNGAQTASAALTLWNSGTSPASADLISFIPTPTSGLTFAVDSQALNTSKAASAPSTCIGDMATFGGEALDGPSVTPGDENNGWMHCSISTGASTQYAFTLASATETGNSFTGTVIGVFGTSATAIIDAANNRSASTPLNITVHATKSGAAAIVGIAHFNSTARTVTSVAFTNGTGGTSAFTQCTSCANTTGGGGRSTVWFNLNEPSGATTIHIVMSGAVTQLDAGYLEVLKGTGSFAEDVGGKVTAGTGNSSAACASTGTFDCGASVTTTGALDLVVASFNSASSISACPQSANEFGWASLVWNTGNDGGFCALLTTTAAAHRPIATDGSSGASFDESTEAIK